VLFSGAGTAANQCFMCKPPENVHPALLAGLYALRIELRVESGTR
jgi:hypothetical protein